MHDVQPAAPVMHTEGPVDELRHFSLQDFRRLAGTPHDARAQLMEKFYTLQKESFLDYLDARDAWRQSPLYRQYQQAAVSALQNGQPLSSVLSRQRMGDQMTIDEYAAIVDVGKALV